MTERCYQLDLVGGPYDGAPGLYWRDDGVHPPPELIYVGVCPGDGTCTGSQTYCMQEGGGRRHPAFWAPEEGADARPPDTFAYRRMRIDEERELAVYGRGDFDGLREAERGEPVRPGTKFDFTPAEPVRAHVPNCRCTVTPFHP